MFGYSYICAGCGQSLMSSDMHYCAAKRTLPIPTVPVTTTTTATATDGQHVTEAHEKTLQRMAARDGRVPQLDAWSAIAAALLDLHEAIAHPLVRVDVPRD